MSIVGKIGYDINKMPVPTMQDITILTGYIGYVSRSCISIKAMHAVPYQTFIGVTAAI